MSPRVAISLAAAVIGISCIATDASARGGGGGGGGGGHGGGPMAAASVSKAYNSVNTNAVTRSYKGFPSGGLTNTPGNGQKIIPRTLGAGGPTGPAGSPGGTGATGGGAAMGAGYYYAPASYNANTACGRYPYPPCNKVLAR